MSGKALLWGGPGDAAAPCPHGNRTSGGEYTGIREMRKHVAWYTTGIPHSAKLRKNLGEMKTYEDLVESTRMYVKESRTQPPDI